MSEIRMNWQQLYANHIDRVSQLFEKAMTLANVEGVVIFSGKPKSAFLDDTYYPFKANPFFKWWVPLPNLPQSAVIIKPAEKPQLVYFMPQDFWHVTPEPPAGYWVDSFNLTIINKVETLKNVLPANLEQFAFLGEEAPLAADWGIGQVNPGKLVNYLSYHRAYKTDYEQQCLILANQIAMKGHNAAIAAFQQQQSELDIHLDFLKACGHQEAHAPYNNIVALNEHGAVLHYDHYQSIPPKQHLSLLVDAGASFSGYIADITRTTSAVESGLFNQLVEKLDQAQQWIIQQIKTGMDYAALHDQMHQRIATILTELEIVNTTADACYEQQLTRSFFPHGLGHLIGLQTHDVGGWQQDEQGTLLNAHPDYPFLRLQRPITERMAFTIEPGIYFIDLLLDQLSSVQKKLINWSVVDVLKPYGGVRIEDTIIVQQQGTHNITRDSFSEVN
ncbi:Xaa-Pro dipeptidase [Spartinivicinus poritis]|uniref:Xaa-Pro dipeptidase n=1 Tax=Spartinivicinus poritis TaxID=2994640 RepID=A0ABT5U924_9GAMM|nr:Xaa-Pro dipeptidase [Spartinivicinus sp. A2-2]MDE1462850.1 Xaa-Pro dipeptidase [Spartinivicinus sp. A2-2]